MVWTECELASLVVRERLRHGQENALARRISLIGISRQCLKFGNDRVESSSTAGVVHVKEPVRAVVRMKRKAEASGVPAYAGPPGRTCRSGRRRAWWC